MYMNTNFDAYFIAQRWFTGNNYHIVATYYRKNRGAQEK